MPLIKCPECDKEVSTLADICPNCGRPMKQRKPNPFGGKYKYFCPICCNEFFSTTRDGWKNVNGKRIDLCRCICCDELIEPLRTKFDLSHYMSVAREMYGHENEYMEVILEEIKQNPLFSEKKYRATKQKLKEENDALLKQKSNEYFQSKSVTSQNVPKCPTCGSTNVEKISTLSKAAGAYTFGLLSKTARSQFKCKNCGYKW